VLIRVEDPVLEFQVAVVFESCFSDLPDWFLYFGGGILAKDQLVSVVHGDEVVYFDLE